MSDDLVRRFSTYNVMMSLESGFEVPTPDGEWVKYKDYKTAADRIEELELAVRYEADLAQMALDARKELEDTLSLRTNLHGEATYLIHRLEAELAKAVEALEKLARLGNGDHYGNSDGNMIARTIVAELKGQDNE